MTRFPAYTAGAYYGDPPVFGSLTLGGFDRSRFAESSTLDNVAFGSDISRDLLVELQSITYDTVGSLPLLTESIYVFIDSLVTHLWLSTDVCREFEEAFGLKWNSTAELYLVDDDLHSALVAQNPELTLTLGRGVETVDIVLPYDAFDLQFTQPDSAGLAQRHFPLKHAQNSTQFTLGRVSLQEAYVIADYGRHNFSISQARFPPTSVTQ